ncbi:hypothetical protein ZEAMMB73_Zm00001d034126 [Zea mays]|uniref:Uncharacterized protein n=1 Tax=Zea mays TaxID=4577 RepID=A0A1D6L5P5_MAIZE|nr:hypothetical protein ZEAMMB73_Zm00001d034126 [Zea mays]
MFCISHCSVAFLSQLHLHSTHLLFEFTSLQIEKDRVRSTTLTMPMERAFRHCDKDTLKVAMLKHEETFRQQVHELHRLYRIQKLLMRDLKRGLKSQRNLSTSPNGSCTDLSLDVAAPVVEYVRSAARRITRGGRRPGWKWCRWRTASGCSRRRRCCSTGSASRWHDAMRGSKSTHCMCSLVAACSVRALTCYCSSVECFSACSGLVMDQV